MINLSGLLIEDINKTTLNLLTKTSDSLNDDILLLMNQNIILAENIKKNALINNNDTIDSPHDSSIYAGFDYYIEYPHSIDDIAGNNFKEVLEAPQGISPLSIPTIIYVTKYRGDEFEATIPIYTGCTEEITTINDDENYAQFAGFFSNPSILYIPKKVEYNLKKYLSKNLLRAIDYDETIAIEKCLIFLNNLSPTYYSDDKWTPLHSTILDTQLVMENDNTHIYTKVIKALKIGTKTGAIIEVKTQDDKETYQPNVISKQYKISDTYLKAGLIKYELQTPYLINRRRKEFFRNLNVAYQNVIASNLIQLYGTIDLPSSKQEILNQGKILAKNKAKTKKNKIITLRNKQSNNAWKDTSKRTFVEDSIELYEYLTDNGFMIPSIGTDKSGGRVVDSFVLMPSWIRSLIKIDGEEIIEVDVKAMHPNLAIKIYGGNEKYLTHQMVSEKTNIALLDVKEEHLSFFNKQLWQMKESPLWEYYQKNEPLMMKNIIDDKYKNGYKITSKKMFKLEVEIMTEVIKRLNEKGIYVGYVYDALFCKKSEASIVKEMMNKIINEFEVYTLAS